MEDTWGLGFWNGIAKKGTFNINEMSTKWWWIPDTLSSVIFSISVIGINPIQSNPYEWKGGFVYYPHSLLIWQLIIHVTWYESPLHFLGQLIVFSTSMRWYCIASLLLSCCLKNYMLSGFDLTERLSSESEGYSTNQVEVLACGMDIVCLVFVPLAPQNMRDWIWYSWSQMPRILFEFACCTRPRSTDPDWISHS